MSKTFSYTGTKRNLVLTVLAVAAVAAGLVITGINPNTPKQSMYGGMEHPATLAAMANSCGNIFVSPPMDASYGIIPEKLIEEYAAKNEVLAIPTHIMRVPVYGYMTEASIPKKDVRFYSIKEAVENPIPVETILKTMYADNITVVWYTDKLNISDLTTLREYVEKNEGKILAYPWLGQEGQIVAERPLAFAQWGISQSCTYYTDTVLKEFLQFSDENRVDRPEIAPEGKTNKEGQLLPIVNKPNKIEDK